MTVLKRAVRY